MGQTITGNREMFTWPTDTYVIILVMYLPIKSCILQNIHSFPTWRVKEEVEKLNYLLVVQIVHVLTIQCSNVSTLDGSTV